MFAKHVPTLKLNLELSVFPIFPCRSIWTMWRRSLRRSSTSWTRSWWRRRRWAPPPVCRTSSPSPAHPRPPPLPGGFTSALRLQNQNWVICRNQEDKTDSISFACVNIKAEKKMFLFSGISTGSVTFRTTSEGLIYGNRALPAGRSHCCSWSSQLIRGGGEIH